MRRLARHFANPASARRAQDQAAFTVLVYNRSLPLINVCPYLDLPSKRGYEPQKCVRHTKHARMVKVASWRCRIWPPHAPQAASEGSGLPSAPVRSDPPPQAPPRGRVLGARPCQTHRFLRVWPYRHTNVFLEMLATGAFELVPAAEYDELRDGYAATPGAMLPTTDSLHAAKRATAAGGVAASGRRDGASAALRSGSRAVPPRTRHP